MSNNTQKTILCKNSRYVRIVSLCFCMRIFMIEAGIMKNNV
ncbi:hypothetical protein HMPREF9144_0592 [Prevotella pallens ATCC 700821]|uniref:Uncharacterized protein n=1 Tax=Prevotella pallens ATCC 700821 TaxID=997353 RepID=F9DG02_9BACT|nr:hypothetical protein HMPREF9144_0592 [Prevotella pallens ATCC 700821]